MNNRLTVPLYASLLSMALLTASCAQALRLQIRNRCLRRGNGSGKTATGSNRDASAGNSDEQENAVLPYQASVLVEGLNAPWEIVTVADGRMFVTERPGAIRVITNGKLESEPLIEFEAPLMKKAKAGCSDLRQILTSRATVICMCTTRIWMGKILPIVCCA